MTIRPLSIRPMTIRAAGFLAALAAGAAFAEDEAPIDASAKTLGDPAAPVALVEFASMSCPHCANFHTERLPRIKEAFIDTGKVKLEFRDFPLNAAAVFGGALAHCAGPDRYFAWLDAIFAAQRDWAGAGFAMAGGEWSAFLDGGCPRGDWPEIWEKLADLGKRGGMSERRVGRCLCDRDLQNALLQSRADAVAAWDVESTPSFVLDGELLDGPPTDRELERAIAAHGG